MGIAGVNMNRFSALEPVVGNVGRFCNHAAVTHLCRLAFKS